MSEFLFCLGLILSGPFLFQLAQALFHLTKRYMRPISLVKIRYENEQGEITECEVNLRDKTLLVEQIRKGLKIK